MHCRTDAVILIALFPDKDVPIQHSAEVLDVLRHGRT